MCLTAGLVISAVLMTIGIVLVFATHEPRPAGTPPPLSTLLQGAGVGDGLHMVYVGLLLLMATPVFRVAVLSFSWFKDGEKNFGFAALGVFVMLLASFYFGAV